MSKLFYRNLFENKRFEILLSAIILISVIFVVLESIESLSPRFGTFFFRMELFFTLLFSVEYILRIYSAENWKKYVTSFYGVVDLLSVLPLYFGFFIPGANAGSILKTFRLFRLFRGLKMFHIVDETNSLATSLRKSVPKILVFVTSMVIISIVTGGILSVVESGRGFNNIAEGILFSVQILTTVGYSDITPITALGKFLTSLVVIIGYGIIAVPTGIITIELIQEHKKQHLKVCGACNTANDSDANYCKHCGATL